MWCAPLVSSVIPFLPFRLSLHHQIRTSAAHTTTINEYVMYVPRSASEYSLVWSPFACAHPPRLRTVTPHLQHHHFPPPTHFLTRQAFAFTHSNGKIFVLNFAHDNSNLFAGWFDDFLHNTIISLKILRRYVGMRWGIIPIVATYPLSERAAYSFLTV